MTSHSRINIFNSGHISYLSLYCRFMSHVCYWFEKVIDSIILAYQIRTIRFKKKKQNAKFIVKNNMPIGQCKVMTSASNLLNHHESCASNLLNHHESCACCSSAFYLSLKCCNIVWIAECIWFEYYVNGNSQCLNIWKQIK